MAENRRKHFEQLTQDDGNTPVSSGIWELPDHVVSELPVIGAADFVNGIFFGQNFACFLQNFGDFSKGTAPPPPKPL